MIVFLAKADVDRQACFDIRRSVFIEEQQIPEAEEWDAHDASSLHFLAVAEDGPAGTARVIAKDTCAKIGRVAVMADHRGTGLGAELMRQVLDGVKARGFTSAELESQVYAIPFYERFGFAAEGPEYDDGSGIMHRLMRKTL